MIWALSLAIAVPARASDAPFAHPYGEPPAERGSSAGGASSPSLDHSGLEAEGATPRTLPPPGTASAERNSGNGGGLEAEGATPRTLPPPGTASAERNAGDGGGPAAASEPRLDSPEIVQEPALPSREVRAAPLDDELSVRGDGDDGRRLGSLGIAGMGTGAAMAGLGGLSLLASVLVDGGGNAARVAKTSGYVLLATGGAAFTAGAIMFGIDLLRPPTSMPGQGTTGRSGSSGASLNLQGRF